MRRRDRRTPSTPAAVLGWEHCPIRTYNVGSSSVRCQTFIRKSAKTWNDLWTCRLEWGDNAVEEQ